MYEQIKPHIQGLSDADLVEYVMTGRRMYDADALAFAREELGRRNLSAVESATYRLAAFNQVARAEAIGDDGLDAASTSRPAILCQRCGAEAPTGRATYEQNIGLLVMRFSRRYAGWFCRPCNHRYFWQTFLITALLGWWGLISFFVTIAFLIGDSITYVRSFWIPRPAPGSGPPRYDNLAVASLSPHYPLVSERLLNLAHPDDIAREVAPLAA